MKIKPELLLNKTQNTQYKKILVTGSDETLINYTTEFIVKKFKDQNYFIDISGDLNPGLMGGLFSEKKVFFLLKDFSSKNDIIERLNNIDQPVLISSSNSKKTNSIKPHFSNSKEMLLIDCYPLNRKSKEGVLNNFIEKENIKLSNNVYWYIVECFDNNYVFFIKQLQGLSFFNKKINLVEEVEKVVFVENKTEVNKMLFYVFKNNNILINIFNQNIYSLADFYVFLNSLKSF